MTRKTLTPRSPVSLSARIVGFSALAALLLLAPVAQATDRTWTGGGGDNNWTTGANWGGTAPEADDPLFFGGATRLTPSNDFAADTAFGGITFNSGAGAFSLGGNRITLGGNVATDAANHQTNALAMILGSTRSFGVNAAGNLTLSGALSGDGGLTKTGPGMLVFTGSNTYTGTTTIAEGILRAASSGAFDGYSGTIIVEDGATFDLFEATLTFGNARLEFAGDGNGEGALRNLDISSRTMYNTHAVMTADATINATTRVSTQFNVARDGIFDMNGFKLTKIGVGILNFRDNAIINANDILVTAGTLRFENTGWTMQSENPITITVTNNAIVDYWGAGGTRTQNITLFNTAKFYSGQRNITFPGTITLNGTNHEIGSGYLSNVMTLAGKVTGVGGFTMREHATYFTTLVLENSENDYSGHTVLTPMNTLRLGSDHVIPDGTGKGDVTINPGASSAGALDLNGFSETINGLFGASGTVPGMVFNSLASSTSTLTVGGNDATSTFAGLIVNNTGTGGTVALGKTGAGTFTLTGANTYSGGTVVGGGVLSIKNTAGSGTGSGLVTVQDGGVLTGTGSVGGNVTLEAGGALASAEGGVGSLSITGDLTLEPDAKLAWEVAETTYDPVAVTGTVALPAQATVLLTGLDASTPDTIPLLTSIGGFTGSPTSWPSVELNGVTYDVRIEGSTLQMQPQVRGTMILLR